MKTFLKTISLIIVLAFLCGCGGGGGSPVDPGKPGDTVAAKMVLAEFADACMSQDTDTATELCLYPDTWRETLKLQSDLLPLLADALDVAEPVLVEDNCITYKVKISHPDDPSYIRENYIYVARFPGENWKLEFEYPDIDFQVAYKKNASATRSVEWDAGSVHPLLSEYIMKYYCAKYAEDTEFANVLDPGKAGSYGCAAVIAGSIDEDFKPEKMPKFLGHFYTPNSQETPIIPGSIQFCPISWVSGSVGVMEWLLGLQPLPALPPVWSVSGNNPNTFQQAVTQMKNASNNADRANAFTTFGYTLHLLEDSSVPAHVRNDAHAEITFDGDYLECWTTNPPQSYKNETQNIYVNLLGTNRIDRTDIGFQGNDLLNSFHTASQYPSFGGVEALVKYTAIMANRMCFSNDTVYKTLFSDIQTDRFPDFTRADLNSQPAKFFGTPGNEIMDSLKSLGIISSGTNDYLIGRGNSLFDLWLVAWRATHWFNFPNDNDIENLLRNAVGGYVSLKDQSDTDYYTDGNLGVREQQWRLLFPLIVKTGAAYLHEYYMYTREPIIEKSPPVAVAKITNPPPYFQGQVVNFSGFDSYDPDGGNITKYEWDWDNNGTYDTQGAGPAHTWNNPGKYYIQLKVTDDENQTDTLDTALEITIADQATDFPVAVAKIIDQPDQPPYLTGQAVNFSGFDSYDPDGGNITKHEWDW
ncbi:MAG: PKD domain-containing protein, partial [bacterium]